MWTLQPRFSPQWIEGNGVLQEVRREVSIDHCLVNIRVSVNSLQGNDVPASCRIWIISKAATWKMSKPANCWRRWRYGLHECQGGANEPRDEQTLCVARRVANELNTCDEEVKKVGGIFAPHLGGSHVDEMRTTRWRIVSSAVDSEVLTAKSASGAPWSCVSNCGVGQKSLRYSLSAKPSNCTNSLVKSIVKGEVGWFEHDLIEVYQD